MTPFAKATVFIQNSDKVLHKIVEGQQLLLKGHKYLMV